MTKFTTATPLLVGCLAVSYAIMLCTAWTPPLQAVGRHPAGGLVSSSPRGASSTTSLSVSLAPTVTSDEIDDANLPTLGDDGVYHILDKAQHQAFLQANPDKLIVFKVYAPWCRACKGLEPKFLQLVHADKYADLPILWADLSIQHNKDFVKEIGVLALPTIQFYIGSSLVDNFPCGPSKVPILKRKLTQFVNDNVDPQTRQLKPESLQLAMETTKDVETKTDEPVAAEPSPKISQQERNRWTTDIPYFAELSLADLDDVLDKAKRLTFEPGSILMREGRPGRTFYIIKEGEVEICQKTLVEDPLTTPSSYLGTVINRLGPGDWFGERALVTGEPRAASIRATEKVQCWTWDKDDFPASSVLSGRTRTNDDLEVVNDKYGVAFSDINTIQVDQQLRDAQTASQTRGSVNTPEVLRGVDTEDDEMFVSADGEEEEEEAVGTNDEVFSLLARFKMISLVSRCFEYIVSTRARWGDQGIRKRRSMLVSRLTPAQRAEYTEIFKLVDKSGDGRISLLELKRVMESIGDTKSDEELLQLIPKEHGESSLNFEDFMGVMAETEFYHLFRDIFASLDPLDTGFVKAGELERVLCGVRDLISDDRKSIIDVDDDDILIEYEQFSRMLLGTALI